MVSVLTESALRELREFVEQVVYDALERQAQTQHERPWLDTDEAGVLLGTTGNAVRCRIRRGWLAEHVVRDGKRLLIRRSALLEDLDLRARACSREPRY